MYQFVVTVDGYSLPYNTVGTGFTDAGGAILYYGYTPYAMMRQSSYYKVAAGNESGQSISGFASAVNVFGDASYRTTFVDVFRPVIGVSTIASVDAAQDKTATYNSNQGAISKTVTSPSAGIGLALVMQASYNTNAITITASGKSILKSTDFSMPGGYYNHSKYRFFTVPLSTSVTVGGNSVYGPSGLGINLKTFTP